MELNISSFAYGTRPAVTLPDKEMLAILGEKGIRQMVSDHYDLLKYSEIAGMFPKTDAGFELAKKHSADFFIQILGGATYYNDSRGKPKLAARHAAFEITQDYRHVWLNCYKIVLLKLQLPDNVKLGFWNYLNVFSHWMVNNE